MRRTIAILVALASPAAAADVVPAELAQLTCSRCMTEAEARNRFRPEQWLNLEDGEILSAEHTAAGDDRKKHRETEATGIIPWPPELVWQVLVDFESRPKFMAGSTKSDIIGIDGNDVRVAQKVKVLWEEIRFTVINTVDPQTGTMDWKIDRSQPHDIAETTGRWQIVPIDDGKHTLLMYRSYTDTGRPVPAILEDYLIKRSLPKIVDAVRDETKRRGKGSAYVLPAGSSERKNK
ncbi:MAG TPA: SRPBCC family protein [Terriglobales bacterium]|nr:SRPBCC family protein [Terriglobales bacterium]